MAIDTQVLPGSEAPSLERALEVLDRGGLVAFPTDTVYGVGADPFRASAVRRLFEAKGRSYSKPLAVLIAGLDELEEIAETVPETARRLAGRFWPGPLTIIVPRRAALPEILSAGPNVGVRVPDHELARRLLGAFGPLAVTSANRSEAANTLRAAEVLDALGGRIDLVLDGGRAPGGVPSTVVDCAQASPVILRPGPISQQEITAALAD